MELGSGPFIALGWILSFAASPLFILAAVQLWSGHGRGAVLRIATSQVVFALGTGFAVSFLLVTAMLRVALVVAGWSTLLRSSAKHRVGAKHAPLITSGRFATLGHATA